MAKISTYPTTQPTLNDILIGSDADNLDVTKNYLIGDIIKLIPGGSLSVQSLNTLTGVITLEGKGGLVVTEVGNIIFIDGSNAGQFKSLTTNGTSGDAALAAGVLNIPNYGTGQFTSLTTLGNSASATLVAGVLNVPQYQRAITVTTSGSGAASLIGANLNIPDESISLTTSGNTGLATLTGNVLNVPQYQRAVTVTTSGSGAASLIGAQLNIPFESISLTTNGTNGAASLTGTALNIPQYQRALTVTTSGAGAASIIGAQLNIPYLNSYNTGTPTIVTATSGGSSSVPATASSGATSNMYSCTWSGSNGNYVLSLPSATTEDYRSIRFITDATFTNAATISVTVTAVFGQTINGASNYALNSVYKSILLWSDGTNWRIIQETS